MSIEQKLQLVFPENFQVKRVSKQISQIRESKEKLYYELRMSFVRGQAVTFYIQFTKGGFKKYKKLQSLTVFQIKIVINKQYPAEPPLIFCQSDCMVDFGLQPFRDYSQFLTVDWSAKFTILDIIKVFVQFLDGWNSDQKKGTFLSNQTFQAERLFSWAFLQTFPVKYILPNSKISNGLLVINCQKQIIVLEQTTGGSYSTKDLIQINQIVSVFRSKQQGSEILLQIKKDGSQTRLSLILRSDDRQNIVICLIEYMKLFNSVKKSQENEEQSQSSSSSNQLNEESEQFSKQSATKINIQQIKEEIILYESLVQNSMTSQNVSNLVILLKKAIEYYSAIGKQDFTIYLKKLKTIMSNQMAQVLLDSASENNNSSNTHKNGQIYNKHNYKSIIDMV